MTIIIENSCDYRHRYRPSRLVYDHIKLSSLWFVFLYHDLQLLSPT